MNASIIESIHHVSFTVKDMDRSLAFYQMLGFKVASDRRNLSAGFLRQITGFPDAVMHVAYLSGFNVQLELIQYVSPAGVDLDKSNNNVGSAHLCFVVGDIHACYEELLSQGVCFRSAPVAIDAGPNAGRSAVYFLDPDGYTLEFSAMLRNP